MTDDRRLFPIGRMSFPDQIPTMFPGDEINLMRPRERNTWTGSIPLSPMGRAQIMFLLGRPYIPEVVGYDPQKLLPSPQHFGREPWGFADQFIHTVGSMLGLTYAEITSETYEEQEPTRWKKAVILVSDNPGDIGRQIAIYSAMPNVLGIDIDIQPSGGELPGDLFLSRWGEADTSPLDDIARWRKQFDRQERFDAVRPNHQLRTYALGLMFGGKPAYQLAKKPQKGYLKHDPTKNHSRRRRK